MKRSLLLSLLWTAIFAHVAETFADSVEPWYEQTADWMGFVRTTSGGNDCLLWTIPTHKGLDYVVSTGRTLDGLKKTGTCKGTNDNLSLPMILEPGTTSGFLSVDVTWGLE